jgi:hypothetical protein
LVCVCLCVLCCCCGLCGHVWFSKHLCSEVVWMGEGKLNLMVRSVSVSVSVYV